MTEQTATGFETYEDFLACFETDNDPRTAQTSQTPDVVGYENPDGSIAHFEI